MVSCLAYNHKTLDQSGDNHKIEVIAPIILILFYYLFVYLSLFLIYIYFQKSIFVSNFRYIHCILYSNQNLSQVVIGQFWDSNNCKNGPPPIFTLVKSRPFGAAPLDFFTSVKMGCAHFYLAKQILEIDLHFSRMIFNEE